MDFQKIVLDAMKEVLGMESDELKEQMDSELDLIEEGVLDSFSIVSLLSEISNRTGKELSIIKMDPADFSTIPSLVAAIKAQCE